MFFALIPCVLLCLLGLSDPPDRPPPLTFDKHVDYIAWYNDFVSKGKKENAYELYQPLGVDSEHLAVVREPWDVRDEVVRALWEVWKVEEHPQLLGYIRENMHFIEVFKKAQERRGYWQPCELESGRLMSMELPQASGMHTTARIILVDAMRDQPNQADALIEAWRLVVGNADHLRQSQVPGLLSSGAAGRESVYEMVRVALAKSLIQGKDIERTFRLIMDADPWEAPSTGWCLVEWAMRLDSLQENCSGGKPLEVHEFHASGPFNEGHGPPEIRYYDSAKVAKFTDEDFRDICKAVSGPFDGKTARSIIAMEKESREKRKSQESCSMFPHGIGQVYPRLLRAEAQRRATLLCLAIHAHKEARGGWPRSLEEVAPPFGAEVMKKIMIDPNSGKNFVYTLKDGEPLLYSVGVDGNDDGGRHDPRWGDRVEGRDYVFWPYQEPPNIRSRRQAAS